MWSTLSFWMSLAILGPVLQATEHDLATGIRQVNDGELEEAVITLDALIQQLSQDGEARAKELSQAYLYKGVALVGLLQEEPAKESFRTAMRYDPGLRLRKGQLPDRVVRVFDAAQSGKTKSVMRRPSGAPKKAGIGTATIAAIAGGVALVAGGAAVAASSGGAEPAPTTTVPPQMTIELRSTNSPCQFSTGRGCVSYVSVPNQGTIVDVSVLVDISVQGNVRVRFGHPDGTGIILFDQRTVDLFQRFDVNTTPDLAALIGKPAAGLWSLNVITFVPSTEGTLLSWSLRLTIRG